jgi:uncharacterized protein
VKTPRRSLFRRLCSAVTQCFLRRYWPWYPADRRDYYEKRDFHSERAARRVLSPLEIVELRVFGSAVREDFRRDSDLDLLVKFAPDADWSLMDHVAMEQELANMVERKVDLVSQRAIERSSNWIRRKAILESAEPFFAAR